MNEETVIKLAVIASLTMIALTGIILNRIDIALITLLTSAIAGIGGYIIGESRSTSIKKQIRTILNEISEILETTSDEANEDEASK
jgi:hypothetical protein